VSRSLRVARPALRAVLWGTGATVLRLLREGMVVRAVVWPGLLAAVAVVGAAAVAGQVGGALTEAPWVAMSVDDAALAGPALAAQGLALRLDPSPQEAVAAGRAERAAWREADRWVVAARGEGVSTLRTEAALRELVGADWRLEVPADPPRAQAVATQSGRMGTLVAVLFALYGVVMGAGLAWRDRGEGVVEGTLVLPVPAWTHGAARVLGLALTLGVGLGATLLLLDGILGMDRVGGLVLHGVLATAVASALGLAAVGGPDARRRGFSAPLSRALGATAALLGLGAALPAVGAWLPVASLPVASLPVASQAATAPLAAAVALLLGLGLMAGCALRWGRHHGGLGT